jgi:hypothetical protein
MYICNKSNGFCTTLSDEVNLGSTLPTITIFGEKIGLFLKNKCWHPISAKLAVFELPKTPNFSQFFGENVFEIITSDPCSDYEMQEMVLLWVAGFVCKCLLGE